MVQLNLCRALSFYMLLQQCTARTSWAVLAGYEALTQKRKEYDAAKGIAGMPLPKD